MDRRTSIGFFFVVMVCMVFVDRVSKDWASGTLSLGGSSLTLGPISFRLVHNGGAAFGMGQGNGLLFAAIAVVVVVAILVWLFRSKELNVYEVVAFGLIAAGGIGNLIDRLTTGYVVDFIQLNFIDFPVFNFADMCVTVGVALVLASAFAKIRSDQKEIFAELEEKSAAERKRKKEAARLEALEKARAEAIARDEEIDPEWGDDEAWEQAERAKLEGAMSDEAGQTGYVGTAVASPQNAPAKDADELV